MYGEKAYELIKQLSRNSENLPPYNVSKIKQYRIILQKFLYFQKDLVNEIRAEINEIVETNLRVAPDVL